MAWVWLSSGFVLPLRMRLHSKTPLRKSDHMYYRWPRSTYGRQSTDSRPIYRPIVDQCITRYIQIYRSTVSWYIGRLSVDNQPTIGRLSVDRLSADSRPIDRPTVDRYIGRQSTDKGAHIGCRVFTFEGKGLCTVLIDAAVDSVYLKID